MDGISNDSIYSIDYFNSFEKLELSEVALKAIDRDLLKEILKGSVEELSLEKLPINDQDLRLLLSYCPKLKSLDLSESTLLTNEGLKAVPRTVHHLFLRGLPLLTEELFDDLLSCHGLETIDLSQTNLKNLTPLRHFSNLRNIFLWQCRQLKDDGLAWLKWKRLDHLDLSFCTGLTDGVVPYLMGVERIDLDGVNFLTSERVNGLAASEQLRRVSVARCHRVNKEELFSSLRSRVSF